MNLQNFEKEINNIILQRGLDYFEGGYVIEITQLKKNEWSAIVEGTDNYRVKVVLKGNEIISSKCSCPYDMGPICKHETAVFYEIRDEIEDDAEGNRMRETGEERFKKILEKMKKEELIDVIIDHALKNDKFYNYILAHYEMPGNNDSKEHYKNFLNSYLDGAMDMYGSIDYYHADDAADGALQLIEDANTALEKNEFKKAITIAQAVIEEMVPSFEFIDDSGGCAGSAVEDAFEILFEAGRSDLPQKTRKDFFAYCLRESEKKIYNDYGDWQYDFIDLAVLASASEDEMNLILRALENYIKAESGEKYSSSYRIEKLNIMIYRLLIKMDRNDEAEKFFLSSLHLPNFRRIALEKAFKNKEYNRVIELALDGEDRDGVNNYSGLVREWKEWRLKVYKRKKNHEGIRKLSYDFLVNNSDISYYETYKKTFDAGEWNTVYENLKKEFSKKAGEQFSSILADILVKEKEFQLLLKMIKQYPRHVSSYQKHFLKNHPEDIYKLHMVNIRYEAKRADNRKRYHYVCGDIKELKKIGGTGEARLLIQEFREIYNRRPAFLDELSKI